MVSALGPDAFFIRQDTGNWRAWNVVTAEEDPVELKYVYMGEPHKRMGRPINGN